MDKIRIIKGSLACFTSGWLALLPIVGIAMALRALVLYRKVQKEMHPAELPEFQRLEVGDVACYRGVLEQTRAAWNPAEKYLIFGCILAWCGLFLSCLEIGGIFLLALRLIGGDAPSGIGRI